MGESFMSSSDCFLFAEYLRFAMYAIFRNDVHSAFWTMQRLGRGERDHLPRRQLLEVGAGGGFCSLMKSIAGWWVDPIASFFTTSSFHRLPFQGSRCFQVSRASLGFHRLPGFQASRFPGIRGIRSRWPSWCALPGILTNMARKLRNQAVALEWLVDH